MNFPKSQLIAGAQNLGRRILYDAIGYHADVNAINGVVYNELQN